MRLAWTHLRLATVFTVLAACSHTVLPLGAAPAWGPDALPTAMEEGSDEAEAEKPEEEHKNAVAVFTGAALRRGDGGAFTLGFDYERRLNDFWGVGPFVDLAFGRRFALVGGVAAYMRPWKIDKAGFGTMTTYCLNSPKFIFPYSENIIVLEVASEKSHQSVKKYCDQTRRDINRKGMTMTNLLSLSILDQLK